MNKSVAADLARQGPERQNCKPVYGEQLIAAPYNSRLEAHGVSEGLAFSQGAGDLGRISFYSRSLPFSLPLASPVPPSSAALASLASLAFLPRARTLPRRLTVL